MNYGFAAVENVCCGIFVTIRAHPGPAADQTAVGGYYSAAVSAATSRAQALFPQVKRWTQSPKVVRTTVRLDPCGSTASIQVSTGIGAMV
jgi:hypothetical protein